jgi:hypothetical protein
MDGVVFTELNPSDQSGQMRALDARGDPLPGSTRASPETENPAMSDTRAPGLSGSARRVAAGDQARPAPAR